MQNIVGQVASKGNFYMRNNEIRRIMRSLEAGANLQIAAPRRVGKSSILYYLKDNPEKGFVNLYIDVESARTKNEYYRKIYREILKSEVITISKKFLDQVNANKGGFLSKLKGISIAGFGINFNESTEIDYEEELTNLLIGINLEGDKLILMIDEFPEVILNIVEDNKGDKVEAKRFLQSNRELRNNSSLHGKVQFIYTGSNSLNVTATNLEASSLINDLNSVPVYPLTADESKDLVNKILTTYNFTIETNELNYLISKVEWNIPFYFQLIIHEIISLIEPTDKITNDIIDKAIILMLDDRNDHHFEHYVRRLSRIFETTQQSFVKAFLCQLSQNDAMTKAEAINLAYGIGLSESQCKTVLNTLKYDGYVIAMSDEDLAYKFNSPILKKWWYNHEC